MALGNITPEELEAALSASSAASKDSDMIPGQYEGPGVMQLSKICNELSSRLDYMERQIRYLKDELESRTRQQPSNALHFVYDNSVMRNGQVGSYTTTGTYTTSQLSSTQAQSLSKAQQATALKALQQLAQKNSYQKTPPPPKPNKRWFRP